MWKKDDRVKVIPSHYGSCLAGRLGTVLRDVPAMSLVEVEMDSHYLAGIGIVAFKPDDLMATDKPRPKMKRYRVSI